MYFFTILNVEKRPITAKINLFCRRAFAKDPQSLVLSLHLLFLPVLSHKTDCVFLKNTNVPFMEQLIKGDSLIYLVSIFSLLL